MLYLDVWVDTELIWVLEIGGRLRNGINIEVQNIRRIEC